MSIAVDSTGHLVAYSLVDGTINIYDIVNKKTVQNIFGTPGSNPILKYAPGKGYIASTEGDSNNISN